MDGHLFVAQADLTDLVCDEVLIPTDQWLAGTHRWAALRPLTDQSKLPREWKTGEMRVTAVLDAVAGLPRRRMVNSGATGATGVEWLMETVDQALSIAGDELAHQGSQVGRARPLLALPVLGTGAGGYHDRRGDVIDGLLRRGETAARDHGIDIALICYRRSDLTAVQGRRSRLRNASATPSPATELGRLARSNQLAVFLGAGVSIGAGLPGWRELLCAIARSDSRTVALQDAWGPDTDLWEAASSLSRALGDSAFRSAVLEQLSQSRFSLSHALVASLPGREVVTTNFDALYESARRVRETPTFMVLPYERASADAYLLKFHGDAKAQDIVLDREALLRYDEERRPLAGLLQGLLLTRHLVFIGASMDDANVIRNIDPVAELVRRYSGISSIGSIITLCPDEALEATWRAKGFQVLAAGEVGDELPSAARALEVFLDEMLLEATFDEGAHLLDRRYSALLDEDETCAAEALRAAVKLMPDNRREWQGLLASLRAHGAGQDVVS